MNGIERLEEIKSRVWKEKGTYAMGDYSQREGCIYTLSDYDYEWLIEQAERVEELKKERNEWKGKYSILKNKYRALQRKMKNKWRYNRALENESRTNEIVLEEFREENKRYREVIEDIKKTSDDYRAGHLLDIQDSFFVDEIIAIINNLEGEDK